ncbi:hypothetical protein [Candidatus Sororendozoicomonas aggregata]|uniref:hypothetical protein n=1 Tax=Candidatus Sororendozoicomonas aggregata TaxID=3073239 RepID=UPI002ED3C5E4
MKYPGYLNPNPGVAPAKERGSLSEPTLDRFFEEQLSILFCAISARPRMDLSQQKNQP